MRAIFDLLIQANTENHLRKFRFLQLLHFQQISENVDKTLREDYSQEDKNRKKFVAFAKNEYFCGRKTQ